MRENVCVNALCSGSCLTCVCSPSREDEEDELGDDDFSLMDQDDRDEMAGKPVIDLSARGIYVFSVR